MSKPKLTAEQRVKNKAAGLKKARVTREVNRLSAIFAKLSKDTRSVAEGLIRRAAYMRVTLEDYEKDIDSGGSVEMFKQTENAPTYERVRPVAQLYNTLSKNYQTICKQLTDLLPKDDPLINLEADDGFDAFVAKKS
ncbi:hypothetical protein MHI37_18350 [Paenibacillus sp. FSL H8-0548]|uniref:hypothetical protein n=1 Tax=Paenibacillus sp. FSL H8-0548 TaxID=1920422 RepID=UPI0021168A18|nr:hypothetical protein [Paenibacillus sp. FSL H8-0548]